MEDTYQPPFKSCVQQGKASCLMCAYNSVNGVPACANQDLIQKLRDEWGFKGYITFGEKRCKSWVSLFVLVMMSR